MSVWSTDSNIAMADNNEFDDTAHSPISANSLAPSPALTDDLFAYQRKVQDPVIGGELRKDATLATLYGFDDENYPHNRLLKDLAGTASFAIPCQLHVEDLGEASVLSDFPNRNLYGSRLKNVPNTTQALKPAIRKVLNSIVAQTFSYYPDLKVYKKDATDAQARLHWLEMPIATDKNVTRKDRSVALLSHIRIFMDKVFPDLQKLFAVHMHKEVTVIVAYGHALAQYQDEFRQHQEKSKLGDSHYPRVLGVDAA